ncbi:MAG: SIS domain-containing protein [Myxococcales bacterium]|nr:SIS domain-containing protein [Myxococcales bacterium]MCB9642287.1 SIS domain-containing protein [Myxococcales bacterium]
MCGIVGLLTLAEAKLSPEEYQRAVEQADALQKQLSDLSPEQLYNEFQQLQQWIEVLPGFATALAIGEDPQFQKQIERVAGVLREALHLVEKGQIHADGFHELEQWNLLGTICRDLLWRLEQDVLGVQQELSRIAPMPWADADKDRLRATWQIEFALRGLQRLEIRGRDSGGISILLSFPSREAYDQMIKKIEGSNLRNEWSRRQKIEGLLSGSICGHDLQHGDSRQLIFLYKVAAEIGNIGDNVRELRRQIHEDEILQKALALPGVSCNPLTHTRWASNGIINEYNCHPQGNDTNGMNAAATRLFAVLNGDVDNFQELLDAYTRRRGKKMPAGVTTDAKIIPLLVEERYRSTGDLREAFRQCLQEFQGSFAIALHHLDHPEKVWLGIGGSGQSLYLGIHPHTTFFASELYGVVEGSSHFVKLDGEREREPGNADSRGQLLELSAEQIGQKRPFQAWSFDGVELTEKDLKVNQAQITTRDIDIADYPHFFLKEISESVSSVRKTLHGRFFLKDDPSEPFLFNFDDYAVPESILRDLREGKIKQIFCIGQGTAAVAAMGVAEALQDAFDGHISIRATKATELSGHMLREDMEDVLAIAVSQSGTTTDTNRTVDLLRQRGARVLAILNRRNSDLAFKAEGVLFTSDGRDVEMSVASTKAFYSQVTAGALLALYLGYSAEKLSKSKVLQGLQELTAIPAKMEQVLALNDQIKEVAHKYALQKRYWAVVGSGPNQIAAHEIRIKLSELCYKSISCDYIEDKKHIDLSAEPLMLISALGLDEANLSDSVKEVAIFKAHQSIPLVIASQGIDRFQNYAHAVFTVPSTVPHLSPILSTIVGHLFGYHAACAIDEQSQFMRQMRSKLLAALPILETEPEKLLNPNKHSELRTKLLELLHKLQTKQFNSALEVETATRIAIQTQRLLYAHLDEMAFDKPEETDSPFEVAQRLLQTFTQGVNELSRPIDAIKHQAKTVTVGISRPSPTLSGPIGQAFRAMQLDPTLVLWRNLAYLIAAERLINKVKGAVLYRVEELDAEGFPNSKSKIFKEAATGIAEVLPSRTQDNHTLRGSKWLALKKNVVTIGVGRNDDRKIAIIPLRGAGTRQARILLLHLDFNEEAALSDRLQLLRARGPIYDLFRAAVTEISKPWSEELLAQIPVEILFDDTPDRFINTLQQKN